MDTRTVKAGVVGLAAGAFAGLFGVGGGVIIVPGLVLWIGLDQYRAAGTSVATIVASSAAALTFFALDGSVDAGAAVVLFAGAGVGAWMGARYITRIPQHLLITLLGLLVALAAVRMWL